MRPKIPPYLEREIDKIYEEHGYTSKSQLVKDAVRIHLEDIKDE